MASLPALRTLILAVLLFGSVGSLTELLLLSHYEDAFQMIPLVLLAAACGVAGWHIVRPAAASVRALQGLMVLFLCAGAAGVAFHFNGAAEFQLEMNPSQGWTELVGKALRVHAPPVLAPGVMMQLGLLGLIYTYRHPAVRERGSSFTE